MSWSIMHARAARHYENEIDLVQKYGRDEKSLAPYLPEQEARRRAWACWSAAADGGLVLA